MVWLVLIAGVGDPGDGGFDSSELVAHASQFSDAQFRSKVVAEIERFLGRAVSGLDGRARATVASAGAVPERPSVA